VTNQERAEIFFDQGARIYRELETLLAEKRWPLALRRAQEVIEFLLKGLLLLMSADYPKSHDPAPAFFRVARERGLEIDRAFEAEIRALSMELARERGPAFYGEIPVTEEEARRAVEGAARVWEAAQRWWKVCCTGQCLLQTR
jgi:HEPN domain-containing protein